MTYPVQRKYPRIPFEEEVLVEYLERGTTKRVSLSGAIHTVACEGMGLRVDEDVSNLERKMRVTVTFPLKEGNVSLPGAVAWLKPNELGIHLLLELAVPVARHQWAQWIVTKTQEYRRSGR